MGGVIEVRAPDGQVWWVKRAWMPRYRSIRDRLARWLGGRERTWWDTPLRWFAGRGRYVDELPGTDWTGVDLVNAVDLGTRASADLLSSTARALDVPAPLPTDLSDLDGGGALPDLAQGGGSGLAGDLPDLGDVDAARLLDVGGASALLGDTAPVASAPAGLVDVGGGGDLPGDVGDVGDVGGGGLDVGGGFDLDVPDDPIAAIGIVIAGAVVAVVALLVLWFVVVPVLLTVVDGAVLLLVLLSAGLVRLLFRRPWDVVAVQDLEAGARRIRRWEVRGYRRAGHVRDDVARALQTGTDPDLAVARVVVREPRDDDPAGTARSVQEIEGYDRHPADAVSSTERRPRGRGSRPRGGSRRRSGASPR